MNQNQNVEILPIPQEQKEIILGNLVLHGNLSVLSPFQKVEYYKAICERIGLDPMTQPFKLLRMSGKEVMYCDRSGAQQLNKLHKVSHNIIARETVHDCYVVTARASLPNGRHTESIGAVSIGGLRGESFANAIMKAETKAKRRSTLDLLGLGMLDESEIETIPGAQIVQVHPDPQPVNNQKPTVQPTIWPPSEKQIEFIRRLIMSHVFTDEEREKAEALIADPQTSSERATRFIRRLKELIDERKKAEKEAETEAEREAVKKAEMEKRLWTCRCGKTFKISMTENFKLPQGESWWLYLPETDNREEEAICPECQQNMEGIKPAWTARNSEEFQTQDKAETATEEQIKELKRDFLRYGIVEDQKESFICHVEELSELKRDTFEFTKELLTNFGNYFDGWRNCR